MTEEIQVPPAADGSPAMSDSAEGAPTSAEPEVPAGLRGVDPEKLAALREKLKKFATSDKKTISGSEMPTDAAKPEEGEVTTGKDVDWSEYDLPYNVKHLYPDAKFRDTPQGPKWVAMLDEFTSSERAFGSYGKRVANGEEFLNLGQYLNDMLNGPDGWTVVTVLPAGMGRVGVLLRREFAFVLPDPKPLKKDVEVEAPTDPELEREEAAALKFAESVSGEPDSAPPTFNSLEEQALALNPKTEHTPPPLEAIPTGDPDAIAPGVQAVGEAVAQRLADGTMPVAREHEGIEEE
jgi:hypothetical protein